MRNTPAADFKKVVWYIIPVIACIFAAIFYPVFIADYAYLGEAHQLWFNQGKENFLMFHTQGRWLTGLLFDVLLRNTPDVSAIRYLRIFSLAGWTITACTAAFILRNWFNTLQLPKQLWLASLLFFCAGLPVVICIGWASCMEMFAGVLAALLGGHLVFTQLTQRSGKHESGSAWCCMVIGHHQFIHLSKLFWCFPHSLFAAVSPK